MKAAPPVDPQSFERFAVEFDFQATLTRDHSYFLERLPERRRRALDVGCGGGGLAFALAPHFERVRGVDISEPLLALARAQRSLPNVEYVRADVDDESTTALSGSDGGSDGGSHGGSDDSDDGWDLIVSHTLLHHLADPARTVRRLAGLLSPGGRLLLVDNVSWTDAIPRAVFLLSPWLSLASNIRKHGLADARRLLRFSLSKPWIDHLVSDRYLTEEQFRGRYGEALPGAEMTRMSVFMGADWSAD